MSQLSLRLRNRDPWLFEQMVDKLQGWEEALGKEGGRRSSRWRHFSNASSAENDRLGAASLGLILRYKGTLEVRITDVA